MDADGFREVCLNLPGATESFPFGPETPVFKAANGKVFAIMSEPGDPSPTVTLKAAPEDGLAVRAQYPRVTPGYHMNKRHWLTVPLDVPETLLVDLVTESYRLVRPKLR
jgi:predicted DNA-binding protein (MmcQ/YjbR family)